MYNKKFFARRVSKYHDVEIVLAYKLYNLWKPTSVIDVGCGIGSYIAGFRDCDPLMSVCGLEIGARHATEFADESINETIIEADVGSDLTNWPQTYDLVLCIEVAEHLEEQYANQLCRNLKHFGNNRILLTAATPGQKGRGHINCQPHDYWIDRMEGDGWLYDKNEVNAVREVWSDDPLNLLKNLMIFRVGEKNGI
jgi:SAM-dependent methyltransferase